MNAVSHPNLPSRRKLLIVFGTRPEALKCFPVARAALAHPGFTTEICVTGQHREMVDQVIELTGLPVHYDLNIMQPGQTLFDVTSRVLLGMAGVLEKAKPDVVIVQGDTTTAMTAALAAFYKRIPVAHIEAGLRSHNINSPFPEELNRKIAGNIATWHFAPTTEARDNLIAEGKAANTIFVTGNTVIDTLLHFSSEIDADKLMNAKLAARFPFIDPTKKMILVTGHRRENFDGGIQRICTALKALSARRDVQIIYPVHPNPNVRSVVEAEIGTVPNIHLIDPQDYLPFLYLQKQSYLVLTDSGGVQEEAPSLGKPVLVMRENTERPEGIAAGTARLVGTDIEKILANANSLLDDESVYRGMAERHNPYGNGQAASRIVEELLNHG
ncbi:MULTISPECIES: UDP-N-acetylglucosamine 2-epimerase (non-hydrolyzing) [unclassified Mesorhizobium]|uniref:non-hydrolyzing UDP-N-acetylglucosamine 2-epimerase n=1 Tax=unclassified Mesorhizobium TaxID=325217 RepID=UPI0003CE2EA1|nr:MULTISPECIES: UDP-N-acetylglucosamine 2-epimerase (non-hydrolyzing) [unclassified Mesorhizobium]ESY52464.1 UDP-N-acetylglucosamine 2-epimerase [Mesorhizobium sp. LNJC374B00]ESY61632.1 UDP-N-acetylglucosamine 2-epimerase [Mesorhizobium sp. LNJC372A00]ESZ66338.1 UDP-N-acetylglucosamine 2-epimerase [Mesorhizobium sp. L103C120A0]WJI46938.1 UDP-N-acetylglucosamine 2-epimerase (non-hydrolyzing) [Mesorhizobium sp. C120A]WJI83355.1 UDP-N-acetylglucosamine 2-epimerase (non-hydrolyzing) [Mesorhizobiu